MDCLVHYFFFLSHVFFFTINRLISTIGTVLYVCKSSTVVDCVSFYMAAQIIDFIRNQAKWREISSLAVE